MKTTISAKQVIICIAFNALFLLNISMATAQTTISGIINTYAQVTAIDTGCLANLTVASSTGFKVGDTVMIIQMNGATVNLNNNPSFGSISSYNGAGNYELNIVLAVSATDIALQNVLIYPYDPSSIVQIIKVPSYSDVTVSGTLTAQPWNGTTGGVLALQVNGTLTLSAGAQINTGAQGFRRGDTSENISADRIDTLAGFFYPQGTFQGTTGIEAAGGKAEGIAILPTGYETGRGAPANGGGGGNPNGGGAGGGGNYAAGGGGGGGDYTGYQYNGGVGGRALTYSNGVNKIFMGGGGGGGFQNNDAGTVGGNGGGIIVIKANTIVSNGNTISSIGGDGGDSPHNDGTGGGGAGGTVLLDVQNYTGNLTVNTSGGRGGNNPSTGDGPGGGGGGGILWYSGSALPGNVTSMSVGGAHGQNDFNGNHGLSDGAAGGTLSGLQLQQSNYPTLFYYKTPLVTLGCGSSSSVILNNVPTQPGASYSWSPATGLSCTNCPSPVASPDTTTVYLFIVNGASGSGCFFFAHDTVVVSAGAGGNVNEKITTPKDTVCQNTTVVLSLSNPVSGIEWQSSANGSNFNLVNGANGNSYSPSQVLQTTYYRVIAGAGTACADTSPVFKLTVDSAYLGGTLSAIRDTICAGTAGSLSVSGNSSNNIQWQSSTTVNGIGGYTDLTDPLATNKTSYRTVPLVASTWYRVTVGAGACAAVSDTLQLVVPPALTASFTSSLAGKVATFDSHSSIGNIRTYFWDFGDGVNSAEQNPVHTFAKDTIYNVCLTIYDGSNCSYTFCRNVDLRDIGVATLQLQNSFIIYPSPFGDELNIDVKQVNVPVEAINMYNVLGQQVLTKLNAGIVNTSYHLNVASLAAGMYYLQVKTGNGSFVQKVVKQ